MIAQSMHAGLLRDAWVAKQVAPRHDYWSEILEKF